jgi:anti-sigma regulatory factor (Ser/Thr protein kinase)
VTTSHHALRFPATWAGFEEAATTLQRLLESEQLRGEARYNVELAFEEIGSNIVRHGAATGHVDVAIAFHDNEIVLTFEDDGVQFDPGTQLAPPTPASIDEAQIGGLGLVLVRKISTRMKYARTPEDRNQLTLAIPAR